MSQKQMAELLVMDSTTLTRAPRLPRRKDWVRSERGPDHREFRLSLTAAGQKKYRRVLPYWESAQKRLRLVLGEADWNQAIGWAVRIANAVRKLG